MRKCGVLRTTGTAEASPQIELLKSARVLKQVQAVCIAAVGALTATTVTSCFKNYTTEDTPILCTVFAPITWVESDTKKTREQINIYNQTWDSYCNQ